MEVLDNALERVYGHRFSPSQETAKQAIWRELARYLQRYVPEHGAVLDLACDRGEFIGAIRARERWASDLRDVSRHLPADVNFVQANGLELAGRLPPAHFDTVFMSNYLEHLPSGEAVIEQLRVAGELLRPGGRVVVLQPNIRLTGTRYWDFIDHKTALTERSLVEAAELGGLRTERLIVRFLPYTTKSKLPSSAALVRLYLAFPPAWRLLGKQTLYVGSRP
ncbi:MAG TPA: methyltransferase domain-containing protein [Gaiellaceae bacterium]|nr:methyltransferase domain-containing protein [Gaiellaceae bacterium]